MRVEAMEIAPDFEVQPPPPPKWCPGHGRWENGCLPEARKRMDGFREALKFGGKREDAL